MTEDNESKDENEKKAVNNQEPEKQIPDNINYSSERIPASSSEGGNKTMALTSLAMIMSVIAISISLIILFTSEKGQKEAKNELSEKLSSALERIEVLESKLIEADNEGIAERTERGLLELKKALLSFQEARTLIRNDELINKLLKIEDEMKSLIILPEPKDVEIEPDIDIQSKTEDKDVDTVVNEASETTSQATENKAPQENEAVAKPIMADDTKPEDEGKGGGEEMNEVEKLDTVVNDENIR
jgi:hypothetical protein